MDIIKTQIKKKIKKYKNNIKFCDYIKIILSQKNKFLIKKGESLQKNKIKASNNNNKNRAINKCNF